MSAYRMLVCYRCRQRTPSYQMTIVIRPSARWNKRHYFCPSCNLHRREVRKEQAARELSAYMTKCAVSALSRCDEGD